MRKTFLAIILILFCIEIVQGQYLTPDQKRSLQDSGVTLNEIAQLEKTRINLTSMDLESILKVVDNMRISQESYERGHQLAQNTVDNRRKIIWYVGIIPLVVFLGGLMIWKHVRTGRSD